MTLKYQHEIIEVGKNGVKCPPDELTAPNNLLAFRFVFDDPKHVKNHIPVGVHKPQRVLTEHENRRCFLFSLSCFTKKDGAIAFFDEYKQTIKQFEKIVGNTICGGNIDVKDGLVGKPGRHTHFELFEFQECDLGAKFEPLHKLI